MANTTHYNLKLFESTDHPTWLTDWNDTITNIDNALYRIATGGGDLPDLTEVVARLQALEGRVDSDELRLNVVEGDIVSILSDLQTIRDDITALASRVTVNESDIADLKTQANTTLPGQISAINDSITGIIASVSANTTAISGLDTRVTALENAPSAGLTFTNLGDITTFTPTTLYNALGNHKMIYITTQLYADNYSTNAGYIANTLILKYEFLHDINVLRTLGIIYNAVNVTAYNLTSNYRYSNITDNDRHGYCPVIAVD